MKCERPHRWGGWQRRSDDPVRFERRCRRRACPTVEAHRVTPDQIAALEAQIAENPQRPFAESGSGHVIGRAKRTGAITLIPIA